MEPALQAAHKRHLAFHAAIAAKAAALRPPEPKTYEIPNTPYGVPKHRAKKKRREIVEAVHPQMDDEQCWALEITGTEWTPPAGRITPTQIQRVVCQHFGIKRLDLISERRTTNLAFPRQIAMYLCKTLTARSLPSIGRAFGNRDHTTVLHAVRKIALMVERGKLPEMHALKSQLVP